MEVKIFNHVCRSSADFAQHVWFPEIEHAMNNRTVVVHYHVCQRQPRLRTP